MIVILFSYLIYFIDLKPNSVLDLVVKMKRQIKYKGTKKKLCRYGSKSHNVTPLLSLRPKGEVRLFRVCDFPVLQMTRLQTFKRT